MFSDEHVAHAVACTAGAVALVEAAMPPTGRGRPRLLSVSGLFAGLWLAAAEDPAATHLSKVTEILHHRISPTWRDRFAVVARADDAAGFEAASKVVARLFHAVLAVMDPSPLPKNTALAVEQANALRAQADPADLARRRDLLVKVSNQIVEASLTPVRHLLDAHWDGSAGVDATPIATFARGVRATGTHTSTDPDAGWYVRQGDHTDPDTTPTTKTTSGKRKRKAAKFLFGYDLTLAVGHHPHRRATPPGHGDPTQPPALAIGFILDRPGVDPAGNALRVLTDVRARGHKPGHLGADRAFNNSRPDHFQLPIRALGYQPCYDYPDDELGIQAGHLGALMIEGSWYCPAIPTALVQATATCRAATRAATDLPEATDRATARHQAGTQWAAAITARTAYQLAGKGHPDPEGHQRLTCPATAGKLACPFKPASLGAPTHLPRVDPAPTPHGPPPLCAQHSITMAPEHGARFAQTHPYGSQEWQHFYFRLRNSSEGMHGFLKDDAAEALQRAGGRRVRGIAGQTLLAAFQLAHANTRKITSWLDSLPQGEHDRPRRRVRRRPTRPLGSWTPAGHLKPAQADTVAAAPEAVAVAVAGPAP